MLLLTSLLAAAAVVFSLARWHRAGAHFHALFQFLLMGLNGAFLTGDLFNLFVFFELLLAASYGLALHGSGIARVKAGLHYIVVNLAASLLFLIGVSLIYGVSGTLNMADLAARIPDVRRGRPGAAGGGRRHSRHRVPAQGRDVAVVLLAADDLCRREPARGVHLRDPDQGRRLYRAEALAAPVRRGGRGVGAVRRRVAAARRDGHGRVRRRSARLASQDMARLAAFSVLVSSGTVLAAIGMGQVGVTGGALFYLISSTLGISAFFLLVELVERGREPGADVLAVTREAYGEDEDMEVEEDVGIAIPATMGMLGLAFIGCALVIAGLPPLSGFIAKFALLTAALNPSGPRREVLSRPPHGHCLSS